MAEQDTTPGSTAVAARRLGFTDFLMAVNSGALSGELSDTLADLVKDMVHSAETSGGKPKGKLTFTLNLLLDRGIFEVDADVTVKRPKIVRQRQIMYGTADGVLSPNNRTQLDAFRDVSTAGAAEVRTVGIVR